MVNHIRTLLLNEGSSVNEPWYIDPTFHPVSLSGGALSVWKLIFPDGMPLEEKVRRIGVVMPFAMSAEMSSYRDMFDSRTTVPDDERAAGASTVRMRVGESVIWLENLDYMYRVTPSTTREILPSAEGESGLSPRAIDL